MPVTAEFSWTSTPSSAAARARPLALATALQQLWPGHVKAGKILLVYRRIEVDRAGQLLHTDDETLK
jgi:hypothetical protein